MTFTTRRAADPRCGGRPLRPGQGPRRRRDRQSRRHRDADGGPPGQRRLACGAARARSPTRADRRHSPRSSAGRCRSAPACRWSPRGGRARAHARRARWPRRGGCATACACGRVGPGCAWVASPASRCGAGVTGSASARPTVPALAPATAIPSGSTRGEAGRRAGSPGGARRSAVAGDRPRLRAADGARAAPVPDRAAPRRAGGPGRDRAGGRLLHGAAGERRVPLRRPRAGEVVRRRHRHEGGEVRPRAAEPAVGAVGDATARRRARRRCTDFGSGSSSRSRAIARSTT